METLLIVGFGDIARRALTALAGCYRLLALVRPESADDARRFAALTVIVGDLDRPDSLVSLAGQASHVLHLAPPPRDGATDPRTANLLAALGVGEPPRRLVYVSTSGVYGDCGGAWVDESRPVAPCSDRARRRVDAEQSLLAFGRAHGTRIVILRAPGIYASDRLPLERLRRGTPVLRPEDDVYTNHVHAEDLATMVLTALRHPRAEGVYNACDDRALPMGQWFDLVAERYGLARPPRITREQARTRIPAPLLSFMSESRRLLNTRIKRELALRLRYPTVFEGVPSKRER